MILNFKKKKSSSSEIFSALSLLSLSCNFITNQFPLTLCAPAHVLSKQLLSKKNKCAKVDIEYLISLVEETHHSSNFKTKSAKMI